MNLKKLIADSVMMNQENGGRKTKKRYNLIWGLYIGSNWLHHLFY